MKLLKSLYDWTVAKADHPHANWWLGGVSFLESSVFPVPADVMFIPMIIANRAKAWSYAFISSLASVAGGVFGYLIGLWAFDLIGQPILDLYGLSGDFAAFADQYNAYGAWIVFLAGVSPIPYKVATIASGATQLDIWIFIFASLVSRTLRYYALAALFYWTGPSIRTFVEDNTGLAFTLFVTVIVGGILAIQYVV